MATERDLTLRMGTKLRGGGDEAFKNLGAAAKQFGRDSDAAFKGVDGGIGKMLTSLSRFGDKLKEVGSIGNKALSGIAAAAQQVERSLNAATSRMKVGVDSSRLNVSKGGMGFGQAASQVYGGLSGISGVMGMALPTSALAAFAASVKLADTAVRGMYGSIERGKFRSGVFEDKIYKQIQDKVPVVGPVMEQQTREQKRDMLTQEAPALLSRMMDRFAWPGLIAEQMNIPALMEKRKASDADQQRKLRELGVKNWQTDYAPNAAFEHLTDPQRAYRLFLGKQSIGVSSQTAGAAQMAELSQANAMHMRATSTNADLYAALGLRHAQFGILRQSHFAQNAALANIRGERGYSREAHTEDVFRQIGYRSSLAGIAAEGQARLGAINRRQFMASHQEEGLRGQFGSAAEAQAAAKEKLDFHLASGKTEGDRKEAGYLEEEYRLRDQLTAATERRKAIEEQLMGAQRQSLDLRIEKEQTIKSVQDQQGAAMRTQFDTLMKQIQGEQQRKQGLQENLALQHPARLRTAVALQRKMKLGRAMTQSEISFMQSMPGDIFKGDLQRLGNQRANDGGMVGQMVQELMRGSNQNRREQELGKQALQMKNDITLQIQLDEQGIVNAWGNKIMPALNNVLKQIEAQANSRLDEIENRRMAGQRAQFPQF